MGLALSAVKNESLLLGTCVASSRQYTNPGAVRPESEASRKLVTSRYWTRSRKAERAQTRPHKEPGIQPLYSTTGYVEPVGNTQNVSTNTEKKQVGR